MFSVAPASEWPKIYAGVDRERVRFDPVLTGYLDVARSTRIDEIGTAHERRNDLGYRAGAEKPWLGRHGMLKGTIAEAFEAEGPRTRPDDRHLDRAGRHAARRRVVPPPGRLAWTIGVEGGASILDRDGTMDRDGALPRQAPRRHFEEVETRCFPDRKASSH